MARSDFRFAYQKRARYAEIDAQAVVFNSRYLEYFDIAITEYFRATGFYQQTTAKGGVEFHVAKAVVEYKAPILLDELVRICTRVARIGTSSVSILFEIHGEVNGPDADDLRATGETIQVHVTEARGAPAPVPDWIITLFEQYERRELKIRAPS